MIHPRYALKLARTKLRSKRGILLTSIIVASLLFSALIACIIIFTGAEKSAIKFIQKANNNQYLVKVIPVIPNDEIRFSSKLTLTEIRDIKTFEKQYYEDIRAKYIAFGLIYDKSTEIPALTPAAWMPTNLPEEQRVIINWQSPAITAMLDMKYAEYAKTATNKLSDLQIIGKKYNAGGYYIQKPSGLHSIPNLRLIQNNKEDFGDSELKTGNSSSYGYYINAIHNGFYNFEDDSLLGRYLLTKDNNSKLKGIPVIVSAQEAASLFGKNFNISAEPKDEFQKTAWLKNIQIKLNNYTYQVCYRNSTEMTMLDKIQRDYAEITSNQNNKNYVKPNLLYDYPSNVCGAIITKEDTRTNADKETDENTKIIQEKLGTYVAPEHKLLTFQIVGIANAQPYTDYKNNIENYIKSLITTNDGLMSAVIPIQMYKSLPEAFKFDNLVINDTHGGIATDSFAEHILEFKSINDARTFMDNETCPSSNMDCKRKFTADPYGSNYLILDEISKLFIRIIGLAFPILLSLATIIIWFTVSRIMIENRKETSVYRAMGAKRHDITVIYLTYILLVAVRIAIMSIVLGLIIAYAVDYLYGDRLTNIAISSFGTITDNIHFGLFDLSSPLIWIIIGLIFVISIVASIQPLIRNVLRPPIQDIRNE